MSRQVVLSFNKHGKSSFLSVSKGFLCTDDWGAAGGYPQFGDHSAPKILRSFGGRTFQATVGPQVRRCTLNCRRRTLNCRVAVDGGDGVRLHREGHPPGSGLVLTTCARIAAAAGGSLEIGPVPKIGTIVTIHLGPHS